MEYEAERRDRFPDFLKLSGGILLLSALAFVILVFVLGVPQTCPDSDALANRVQATEQSLTQARHDITQLRDRIDQLTPHSTVRAPDPTVEERISALERAVRQAPWPLWKYAAMAGTVIFLGVVAVFLFTKVRFAAAAAALLLIGLTISTTFIALEIDSLVTLNFGSRDSPCRDNPCPCRNDRCPVTPPPTVEHVQQRTAYAINFPENQALIPTAGRETVDEIARALRPCRGPQARIRLTVEGFASSAPFLGQPRSRSNASNLVLAHLRAEAIADRFRQGLCDGDCRTRGVIVDTPPPQYGYSGMNGRQAVGDASTPDNNRRETEYLTRAALITVAEAGICAFR